jgi:hypothetical protein
MGGIGTWSRIFDYHPPLIGHLVNLCDNQEGQTQPANKYHQNFLFFHNSCPPGLLPIMRYFLHQQIIHLHEALVHLHEQIIHLHEAFVHLHGRYVQHGENFQLPLQQIDIGENSNYRHQAIFFLSVLFYQERIF